MARILVTEEIADTGLDRLRDAGHDVDVHLAPSPEQLLELIKGANAAQRGELYRYPMCLRFVR